MAVFMIYAWIGLIFLGVAYAKSAGYGQELETFFLIFQIVGPVLVLYLKCLEHDVTLLQCLKFIITLPFALIQWLGLKTVKLGTVAMNRVKSCEH
tara:strand:- start:200 stop:484 length:285 start_codon:yes stop_codon:yes gene_type:complete